MPTSGNPIYRHLVNKGLVDTYMKQELHGLERRYTLPLQQKGLATEDRRNGYDQLSKGNSWVRGASGGELPGQAGTKLHAGNQRTERGLSGNLARLGDASSTWRADQGPYPREPRDCNLL